MAAHKRGSRLFSLALVAILVLSVISTTPTTRAQGGRTFPETGKTVSGKFLQYWDGHGGLAQQGFPISEEIQETSDTNGKIYTVQYFERAVFEYHPRMRGNRARCSFSCWALSCTVRSTHRERQARCPTSRQARVSSLRRGRGWVARSSSTGTVTEGWHSRASLSPTSSRRKVTWMARRTPCSISSARCSRCTLRTRLPSMCFSLSLAPSESQAKYSATVAQLNGSGNKVHGRFPLKRGLAVFQSVRASSEGYFYIDAIDPNGKQIATVGAGSGPNDVSVRRVYRSAMGCTLSTCRVERAGQ